MTWLTVFGMSPPPIYGHMQNERSPSFAADCAASDCADRPLSGRDFASSSDFQRQSLARQSDGESVGDPVKGKQLDSVSRDGEKDISSRASGARTGAA